MSIFEPGFSRPGPFPTNAVCALVLGLDHLGSFIWMSLASCSGMGLAVVQPPCGEGGQAGVIGALMAGSQDQGL